MRFFFILLFYLVSTPSFGDLIDDIEFEQTDNPKTIEKSKSNKNKILKDKNKSKARKKHEDNVDHSVEKPRKSPIKIRSSGTSTFSKKKNLIILKRDVVITQEDLRLESDEARVFIKQENGEDVVEKAILNGGVHVSKFDEDDSKVVKARGDKATFFNRQQLIELNGNARLWKGGHLIKGKKIKYDVRTGMISVDEARGVVQPGELKND